MFGAIHGKIETIPSSAGFVSRGDVQGMASFKCRDLGMDCSFEATGFTDQEIMRQFIDHADTEHKMSVLPADIIYRVQNTIKKY